MAEETTTETTTTETAETTATEEAPGKGGDSAAALDKARREAADLRKRLNASEKEATKLREAGESDRERVERERDEAKKAAETGTAKLRAISLKAEVGLQAGALGITNAKAALRLLDESKIEYDGEGEATESSVADALKAAAKEFPILKRAGSADAGEGNGSGGGGKATDKSSDSQFGANLNRALRSGRR